MKANKMHTTLISAETVAHSPAQFRILDCRARLGDPAFGPGAYAGGHIPGALHASLDDDFAAPPGDGGRHPLPQPQELRDRFRGWGINDDDQIVVYDDAGGAFAARAWWCARWLGHEAVAVLDGGLAAWTGPLSQELPQPAPGNFSIRAPLTRTVDAATLAAELETTALVDARTRQRFDGTEEPIDPVAGHIPGAVCLPFQGNLAEDGRFLPVQALAERFAGLPEEVVCYCGSGVTAAHNVLALRIAGHSEPVLYPGSWSEWIRDPARPRAAGASLQAP
jgi:thiosulfate/3-mercaptopyruvate sulfurtransferase